MNNKGLKQLAFELGNRRENKSIVPPITEEDYIDVPEEMLTIPMKMKKDKNMHI